MNSVNLAKVFCECVKRVAIHLHNFNLEVNNMQNHNIQQYLLSVSCHFAGNTEMAKLHIV